MMMKVACCFQSPLQQSVRPFFASNSAETRNRKNGRPLFHSTVTQYCHRWIDHSNSSRLPGNKGQKLFCVDMIDLWRVLKITCLAKFGFSVLADRQTERQTDRQIDRQTLTRTHTNTHTHTHTHTIFVLSAVLPECDIENVQRDLPSL